MLKRLVLLSSLFLSGCTSLGIPDFCPFTYDDDIRTRIVEPVLLKVMGAEFAQFFDTRNPYIVRHRYGIVISPDANLTVNGRTAHISEERSFYITVNPCTREFVKSEFSTPWGMSLEEFKEFRKQHPDYIG